MKENKEKGRSGVTMMGIVAMIFLAGALIWYYSGPGKRFEAEKAAEQINPASATVDFKAGKLIDPYTQPVCYFGFQFIRVVSSQHGYQLVQVMQSDMRGAMPCKL